MPAVPWRPLVALVLVAGLAARAPAALRDHGAVPPEWQAALAAYGQDPVANRSALDPIMKVPLDQLPELYLVAVADAELRAGHPRAAVRAYRELRQRDAGPLSELADLALGTLALELGATAGTRDNLVGLLGDPGPNGAIARLLLALDDAGDGNTDAAVAAFERLAGAPDVMPAVRNAARLGAGYARWWAGQYEGAVAAFDLAANAGDPRLADDARYAAARARLALGQEDAARRAWEALAAGVPETRNAPKPSSALLDLEYRAVVRSAARRYRRGPVMGPADRALLVLDLDGVTLAKAALARTQWGPRPAHPLPAGSPPRTETATAAPAAGPTAAPSGTPPPDAAGVAVHPAGPAPEQRPHAVLVILLLAGVVLAALELRRRSRRADPRAR
ncbi:MAG: hypothetical protein KIT14_11100 [bacterium]|nr:hypothetical protein [bacterium]